MQGGAENFAGVHNILRIFFRNGFPGLADGNALHRHSPLTNRAVFFQFLLVSIDIVVVANICEHRLVNRIVVNRWVIGKEHLVLFQLGIGNGNGGNQGAGIGVQGEVKQLFRIRDLYNISLINNANSV